MLKRLAVAALSLPLALSLNNAANAEGLDELPPELAAAYEGVDEGQPVGPSKYRDWTPRSGPPWKIGYASSYAGNTWRAEGMTRLMDVMLPQYKEAGLVSEVKVTQSDLNDARQIQQIRQLVDEGVDAIIICCSNPVALNKAVKYAYDKGVVVFSYSGYLTSDFALNASSNYTDGGYQIAKALIEEVGGKGNFLLVSGIPGAASSESFDTGARRALEEFPDAKLVGQVAGNWTDQVAQTEVQKFLATNPAKIDGIIAQGSQETGILKAVLQSGRDVMPISLAGSAGAACYLKKNPGWISHAFQIWPPGDEMELGFNSVIRTLQNQGPKVQSILRPVYRVEAADYVASLPEDCSIDSTAYIQPGIDIWFDNERAAGYFLRPKDPLE
ncbi:ABC transporter substrate-binding protein [Hoeflea prorocentri]|uniref:ABC transporter substrate-binding protein n=1 Tax=Hoeflea prorocentri TaxID=1922333 RepID=A0A9X3ZGE1_9HYPH|nr:ABC transporter substrate-binding protein [Hoeflea prorocentri]MCY6379650.1 ABC transporter substrate-binding protein [Hoeflea prorocentri]MDA5397450.1 ABC transporter substrate-binding protein [Hoeflea prorocentri]